MTMIRFEPLREITSLQRDLNRLLDDLAAPSREIVYMPPAELIETGEAYHLRLEIPGINPDELEIQASSEAITISGERQSQHQTENHGIKRSEFRYGKFQRVIPLPSEVDNQSIEADYAAGILTVVLPKAEKDKSSVVKVAVKSAQPTNERLTQERNPDQLTA